MGDIHRCPIYPGQPTHRPLLAPVSAGSSRWCFGAVARSHGGPWGHTGRCGVMISREYQLVLPACSDGSFDRRDGYSIHIHSYFCIAGQCVQATRALPLVDFKCRWRSVWFRWENKILWTFWTNVNASHSMSDFAMKSTWINQAVKA